MTTPLYLGIFLKPSSGESFVFLGYHVVFLGYHVLGPIFKRWRHELALGHLGQFNEFFMIEDCTKFYWNDLLISGCFGNIQCVLNPQAHILHSIDGENSCFWSILGSLRPLGFSCLPFLPSLWRHNSLEKRKIHEENEGRKRRGRNMGSAWRDTTWHDE